MFKWKYFTVFVLAKAEQTVLINTVNYSRIMMLYVASKKKIVI